MLERGRSHPVLGPMVLVLLVLVLALVCLHAGHDGWDGAAEVGVACIVIVTALATVVSERLGLRMLRHTAGRWMRRGPPPTPSTRPVQAFRILRPELVLPLRR